MKNLPASIQTDIANNSLTWALCFKFITPAGYVFGLSTHDSDITYDGVTYVAGADPTEFTFGSNGFISNLDISLLLSDDPTMGFNRNALIGGYYDKTEFEVFIINWTNPGDRLIYQSGYIGDTQVQDRARITIELRSLSQILNEQSIVRVYTPTDPELLGSQKNGIDIADWSYEGVVTDVVNSRNRFTISISGHSANSGDFAYGEIQWTSGDNFYESTTSAKFFRSEIRSNSANTVTLLASTPYPISAGDTFIIIQGYDGSLDQAVNKFDNIVNFRGFPDIPGNEQVISRGNIE